MADFPLEGYTHADIAKEDYHKLLSFMHGNHLIQQDQLNNAKIFSNRYHAMANLVKNNINYLEVGTAAGDYSELVLTNKKINKAILVDLYDDIDFIGRRHFAGERYDRSTHESFVQNRVSHFGDVKTLKGDSTVVLPLHDIKFDYIFLDARHSYPYIKKDLQNAAYMLADGGIIGVDDYYHFLPSETYTPTENYSINAYGVIRAVNEFLHDNVGFEVAGYSIEADTPGIYLKRKEMV